MENEELKLNPLEESAVEETTVEEVAEKTETVAKTNDFTNFDDEAEKLKEEEARAAAVDQISDLFFIRYLRDESTRLKFFVNSHCICLSLS